MLEAPKEAVNVSNNETTVNESEDNVKQNTGSTVSCETDVVADSQQYLEDHSYMNVEKYSATKLEDMDKTSTDLGGKKELCFYLLILFIIDIFIQPCVCNNFEYYGNHNKPYF